MQRTRPAWPYWGVLGLGISTSALIAVWTLYRLSQAFEAHRLTQLLLVETLASLGFALALLLVAGWAFARRPHRPRDPAPEGFTWT